MNKHTKIAGITIGIAALLWLGLLPRSEPSDVSQVEQATTGTTQPAVRTELHPAMQRVLSEMDALRARVKELEAGPAPQAAHSDKEESQPVPMDDRSRDELEAATVEADAARLDSALDAETVDHAWASRAHGELSESLSTAVSGMHVDEVSCHSTLCRVEVSYDSDEIAELTDLSQLAEKLPWESQGAAMKLRGSDGRQYTVLYVSREGHSLPPTAREGS